ncbi:hypothetical protein ABIB25_000153 [Nakamurella sp. UYEF19]
MAAVAGQYSPAELAAIADFLRRTTDVLVANTAKISGGTVATGHR